MDVVAYSFFAYGVTAVLSLIVTGIIVLVSKLTSKSDEEKVDDNG